MALLPQQGELAKLEGALQQADTTNKALLKSRLRKRRTSVASSVLTASSEDTMQQIQNRIDSLERATRKASTPQHSHFSPGPNAGCHPVDRCV